VTESTSEKPAAETPPTDTLDRLMQQVHTRARELPPGSYTTRLIEGGVAKMGAKITEEAAEVVDAAATSTSPDNTHLIYESCDLIYHLWVLLGSRGITVDDLRHELARREGVSGLTEKQNRPSKPNA
jgi:phosphoribosyl-ATP pyrophosphohydrolase